MKEIYSGQDKLGYFTLVEGDKFRPIELDDGQVIVVTPRLVDKITANREMIKRGKNKRMAPLEDGKYIDWGRTAISGFIHTKEILKEI